MSDLMKACLKRAETNRIFLKEKRFYAAQSYAASVRARHPEMQVKRLGVPRD